MVENKISTLKRAQKESLIRKELSKLFLEVKLSNPNFDNIYISNVKLSSDKSTAFVCFYTDEGEDYFNEKLKLLILYKPSMRKALSKILESRYTPQIIFKYDKGMEKQGKIERLLDKIKEQDSLGSDIEGNEEENSLDDQDLQQDI
ncbi:ribosome-binding factor A [Candidatus Dependentiae bacterium]